MVRKQKLFETGMAAACREFVKGLKWNANTSYLSLCIATTLYLVAGGPASAQQIAAPDKVSADVDVVTIVEFFDFACPFSAQAAPQLQILLKSHPRKVQLVVKNLPLPSHPDARLAHQAALAAKQQGKFWEMYDLLLHNQPKQTRADLLGYARQLGLNMERFTADLDSDLVKAAVAEDVAEAAALRVESTPTFFVGGQRHIGADALPELSAYVDKAIRKEASSEARNLLIPSEAPKYPPPISTEGSPSKGPDSAPVIIIEFSDFQCPFCNKQASFLRSLMEEYPGQIRLVFKNFPLNIHPNSPLAHRAALAAQQQGKFWEMHDLLFANQRDLSRDALLRNALQLNLDLRRFEKDLDDQNLQAVIDSDVKEGNRLGIQGTPTMFLNGHRISGIQSQAAFEALFNSQFHLVAQMPNSRPSEGVNVAGQATNDPVQVAQPLTLLWFSDLESPLTPPAYDLIRKAMELYPGKIHLVFKNAPMTFHGEAFLAHEALLAAGAQGKFWPMHDVLLANRNALGHEDLLRYAAQIGLELKKFQAALDGKTYEGAVKEDLEEARVRQVSGTPTFFINGNRVDGLILFSRLKEILDAEFNRALVSANQSKKVADAN